MYVNTVATYICQLCYNFGTITKQRYLQTEMLSKGLHNVLELDLALSSTLI
jgi:hypothetical protein